jgi:Xaa-Pro dipeptidase
MSSTAGRLARLRNAMREAGIDIVALIPGANLRYLSGREHYLAERPIVLFVPLNEPPLAVIPQLEVPLFADDADSPLKPRIFSWTDAQGYEEAFKSGLATLEPSGKVIGVEGTRMRFFEGEVIRHYATGATVVAADRQLAELRQIKDEDEIAALRRAVAISEEALRLTLREVHPGVSEIQLAAILDEHMKELGSEEPSFKTILHAGANTALPHTGPLPYVLQAGDPLLIDFGAVYEGYRADITRTLFVGEPSKEALTFYQAVQAANAAGRAAAMPRVAAEVVDLSVRRILMDAGYGHLIRHRTGHGIGLETHEAPFIVEGNTELLQPGMVCTIEPGIYAMGLIGVRIEDDLLVTPTGAESLSTFSRDLLTV